MMRFIALGVALSMMVFSAAFAQAPALPDRTTHKIQFVTVEKDVRLEVVDWGGRGPPLVFLAGGNSTAHAFDTFAPRFTGTHHVYGITPRGAGASSVPLPVEKNYTADRLGDDVLVVITALRLDRPVLAGHSLGGQELSSVGSRRPEMVRGLIYLDAAFSYAFYVPTNDNFYVDANTVRRGLERLSSVNPAEGRAIVREIEQLLPDFARGLRWYHDALEGEPDRSPEQLRSQRYQVDRALLAGEQKYTSLRAPILAIYAMPQRCETDCESARNKARAAADLALADAFAAHNPSARVVKIADADHHIFESHPDDVQREMDAFLESLR
jgi:pimeloyl-ACP methyl ester carboxylesterase